MSNTKIYKVKKIKRILKDGRFHTHDGMSVDYLDQVRDG